MTRWKLTLEYDGSGFCGWQRQDGQPSVQQAVEEAITSFCKEEVRLHVAGRTDAGVHAFAQVAHADIAKPTQPHIVRDALNFYLKTKPVVIVKAEAMGDDFHARFSATGRAYLYRVIHRRAPPVLDAGRAYHIGRALDVEVMRECASLLVGTHDFSTFRAADCQSKSAIKTLSEARIEAVGEEIHFHFAARSFLYHQVRNMVGSVLMTGTGQWSPQDFVKAFATRDRTVGGPTAPAHALYFVRADYR
jgi:tRNA pseudouridine38-40 synthase